MFHQDRVNLKQMIKFIKWLFKSEPKKFEFEKDVQLKDIKLPPNIVDTFNKIKVRTEPNPAEELAFWIYNNLRNKISDTLELVKRTNRQLSFFITDSGIYFIIDNKGFISVGFKTEIIMKFDYRWYDHIHKCMVGDVYNFDALPMKEFRFHYHFPDFLLPADHPIIKNIISDCEKTLKRKYEKEYDERLNEEKKRDQLLSTYTPL